MDQFLEIFFQLSLLLIGYATVWFLVSLLRKRNDVADIAWGLGYCLVILFLMMTQPISKVLVLLYFLVVSWGLRLSIHIYIRNRGNDEDFRYLKWRKEWGKTFFLRSYFQVFLLQIFFLLVIISPVVWASANTSSLGWSWHSFIGLGTWAIGFFFQSVGDYQLSKFRMSRSNPLEIMKTGLWKFSRHPNYFGEILMWWGIYIVILPLPNAWLFAISPITITLLLRYVSGVPMLEKRYEGSRAYDEYRTKTPALFPKFW